MLVFLVLIGPSAILTSSEVRLSCDLRDARSVRDGSWSISSIDSVVWPAWAVCGE